MNKNWTPVAVIWLILAIFGLAGTWTNNILAIIGKRDFIGDWVNSGPAVTSLTIDLLIAAVAGSIFMIVEARRLGMRLGWLYVVEPLHWSRNASFVLMLVSVVPVAIAASYGFYRLVERPFMNRRAAVTARPAARG